MPAITIDEKGAILHAMPFSDQSGRWSKGSNARILDTAIAIEKLTFWKFNACRPLNIAANSEGAGLSRSVAAVVLNMLPPTLSVICSLSVAATCKMVHS